MTKASDFRIGNYASIEGNEIRVDGRVICDIWTNEISDFKGIVLTEEWLIRLGFFKANSTWYKRDAIAVNKLSLAVEFRDVFAGNANYVHQLQNLYYSLIGNELPSGKNLDTNVKFDLTSAKSELLPAKLEIVSDKKNDYPPRLAIQLPSGTVELMPKETKQLAYSIINRIAEYENCK